MNKPYLPNKRACVGVM